MVVYYIILLEKDGLDVGIIKEGIFKSSNLFILILKKIICLSVIKDSIMLLSLIKKELDK